MVIIGRSFEEVMELLEKAMKRKYPNEMKVTIFEITDEEMQMVMDSTIVDIIESKGRITKAEYQSALLGACKMYDYLLDKVVNKGVLET